MADTPSLSTTLQDVDGRFSSKRIAGFTALACLVISYLANVAGIGHPVPDHLLDLMAGISVTSFGLSTWERWQPAREPAA
jgi:tetrahydromethanopterin S-methyltransferase subunit E